MVMLVFLGFLKQKKENFLQTNSLYKRRIFSYYINFILLIIESGLNCYHKIFIKYLFTPKKIVRAKPMISEEKIGHLRSFIRQFSRKFWIVNTLELLERGAYYGTMAVLAIHLYDNLEYSAAVTGILISILMALLYFVPLVAAALAEKIGYKITLIGAFIFMVAGYLSFGLFREIYLVLLSIIFLGIGAGTFKPMVSATIAHVTEERLRNAGYSIYYWMINLGAFVVPLTIGLFKSANFFDPEKNSELVFFISTALITLNLLITIFKFEDPIKPNPEKEVFASLKVLVTVLEDVKFVSLLMIYAGFWFMFSMNHSFLPLYMKHFHVMPNWFSVFYLAIINPGTIITVGFGLSKVVEKYHSLHLMITGISLFVFGLLMVGLTTNSFLFVSGIVIFSIGEFITHPNFISYVSKIAPKDKVAIYMGYAFIPTGIGYTLGAATGGVLFGYLAETLERPKLFWASVASVGLLTVIGLVLYDIYIAGAKKKEVYDKEIPISFKIPYISDSKLGKHFPALVTVVLIPLVLAGAYAGGTNTYYHEEDSEVYYIETHWFEGNEYSDYTEEGESTSWSEVWEEKGVARIEFSLSWRDEDDASANHENQPDRFNFSVETPWGEVFYSETEANKHGEEHTIILIVNLSQSEVKNKDTNKAETSGEFKYKVTCVEAGNQRYTGPPFLGQDQEDNGNKWTFSFRYTLWEKHEKS